jgi:HK97 family phage prohead protease
MKKRTENLFLKNSTVRSLEENGKRIIEGIIPYNSRSLRFPGGVQEVITPSAFNKTLADGSNVLALFNHDYDRVLGSTRSGTMKLANSPEGLRAVLELGNTSFANDCWEIVSRGDVTTLSFGFVPVKQEIRGSERFLKEVQLREISFAVPNPAYEETFAYTRNSVMEKRNVDMDLLTELLAKEEKFSEEEVTQLETMVAAITEVITSNKPAPEPEPPAEEPSNKETPAAAGNTPPETDKAALEKEKQRLLAMVLEIENQMNSEKEEAGDE